MKKLGMFMFLVLAVAMLGGAALAQNVGDSSVYAVTYYSNANTKGAPDATVRVINDGDTNGYLWAAFYVFDDRQELTECCACLTTPDGLTSESVNSELTANPLTGRLNTRGVIKVISSATNDPTATKPTAGIRAWGTHIQKTGTSTYAVTETKFADANLSSGEQTLLQQLCYFDALLSGLPCTCTPEGQDF
jgi:hypothetical protein